MAGLDKEESMSLIEAARQIFLRFGSTRGLTLVMLLIFLGFMAKTDPSSSLYYAAAGVLTALLLLLSFHRKPHLDRQLAPKVAGQDGETGTKTDTPPAP